MDKPGILGRTYRHVQRFRQILTVLVKYGFGDLLDELNIDQYLELGLRMFTSGPQAKSLTHTRAERIRFALEELGGTFVKMGQILSTRPDLLPISFVTELEKLQSEVPPFPFEEAKAIVEEELSKSLDEAYSSFSDEPLAAASIGQVHQARLPTGERVVVKVQRPKIQETISVDLEIMHYLADLMEKYLEGWDIYSPTMIVDELGRSLAHEVDYRVEAANIERFHRQFEDDSTIYVPQVFRHYTTRRVLTIEYIEGIRPTCLDQLDEYGFDRPELARRGADLMMSQVFVHGFFHADPHPGNVFILPGNVICYIDFGMMGRIDRIHRENVADLVAAIAQRDEMGAVDAILHITKPELGVERRMVERDVAQLIDLYAYRPLEEIEFGRLMQEVMEIAGRYQLRMPADLFMMLKALSLAEAVARTLDPQLDIVGRAAPYLKRVYWQRMNVRRFLRDAFEAATEFAKLFRAIPGETREILKQAKLGKVRIEFEHKGLEPMLISHDRISNRIAFSIVLASQIIGSSLIILADIPPKWHEIPVIGLAGFIVAGLMGFWLLISILRHGRL